jgi:hypothetical protein
MEIEEKISIIRYLKVISIENQLYGLAICLRDHERKLIGAFVPLSPDYTSDRCPHRDDLIISDITKYNYAMEILMMYDKNFGKSQISDIIKESLIEIRDKKINDILN